MSEGFMRFFKFIFLSICLFIFSSCEESEFKDQIIGNTSTKIIFRQDVPPDAEIWTGIAGTFSSQKKTYQVNVEETAEQRTGMGSIREVKEMLIEFDVFKKFSVDQAVLIDKAYHKEDLLRVWKTETSLPKVSEKFNLSLLTRLLKALKLLSSVRKLLPNMQKNFSSKSLKLKSQFEKLKEENQKKLRVEWEKHTQSILNSNS